MDGRRRNLFQASGFSGLLLPSHFQTRPLLDMSRIPSVQCPPLPVVLPSPHVGHDNNDRRWGPQRLQILREQDGAGDSVDSERRTSKAHAELKTQVDLRRYIGDQIPPENKNQTWEQERKQLLETVQHLQEDRDSLCATLELLQVQVQSLQDIHALQEEELGRKVAELEGKVASCGQESAILHQFLRDKAAEVEVEKLKSKVLQGELYRAQDAKLWQQQQRKMAEEHVKLVADAVSSSQSWLQDQVAKVEEAVAQLPSLNSRLGYASRRVRTIQGLVARKIALAQLHQEQSAPPPLSEEMGLELQQLREERNRLDEELQLSACLIQQEVGRALEQGEAEQIRLREKTLQLKQELQKAQESLAEVGIQLKAARLSQKESREEFASLRQELNQQQETYGRDLQEKVAEVALKLRVLSLRQVQRQAARDKERRQELGRLQEEAQREEGFRLRQKLQELEREKNLLLATLKQEGLLSRYKQQRLFAILPSSSLEPGSGTSPTLRSPKQLVKDSSFLSSLLHDLQ